MSLYRLCPWWTAQCPDTGSNYDAASMHSAILTENQTGGELLIVGSHSGYLSIFQPHQQISTRTSSATNAANAMDESTSANEENADASEFFVAMVEQQRPVDLVLEVKLEQPILSISSAAIVRYYYIYT